jgi:flagellar basal body-associated protein FliL
MPKWAYILIAVLIIVALVAVFIISFVLYKKTPPPKGCEKLGPEEGKCSTCNETGCHFNIYANKKKDDDKKEGK